MLSGKICSLSILNKKFYINAVMSFIDSLAENHKHIDKDRYNRFRDTISDLLKLRIENAYPGSEGIINIDISLTEDYVEISINDKGVPFWMDSFQSETVDCLGMENLGKDGQRIFARMDILNKIIFKIRRRG